MEKHLRHFAVHLSNPFREFSIFVFPRRFGNFQNKPGIEQQTLQLLGIFRVDFSVTTKKVLRLFFVGRRTRDMDI